MKVEVTVPNSTYGLCGPKHGDRDSLGHGGCTLNSGARCTHKITPRVSVQIVHGQEIITGFQTVN